MSANRVLKDALGLSERERAEIAARLIASLDAASAEDSPEVREAWAAEIERRCEALDARTASTTNWDDVRSRIEVTSRGSGRDHA